MSTLQVVRNPRHPHVLMLQVDGEPLHGAGEVTLVSKGKSLLELQVKFFEFELLGEDFPGKGFIDPIKDKAAADAAEKAGLAAPKGRP
jgi:hypothetical protein